MIDTLKICATLADAGEISASASLFKELGLDKIVITEKENRSELVRYYQQLGFSIIGIEVNSASDWNILKYQCLSIRPEFVVLNWDTVSDLRLEEFVDLSIECNFKPMVCLKNIPLNALPKKDHFTSLLKSKRTSLCFDPVEIIQRYNVDIRQNYLDVYFDHIGCFVLRDYKIGVGARPCGYGSLDYHNLKRKFADFNGWIFFRSILGDKYFNTYGRANVFRGAYSSFLEVFGDDKS